MKTETTSTATVKTVVDSQRGCGWRKPGGLYFRCDGIMVPCGKLPVPLAVCPCCSAGIKPARGWTWFNPRPFLAVKPCSLKAEEPDRCQLCPMETAPERAGLLWIGEKFYPTPEDYQAESRKLGVSRRITRIPQGYKPGDRIYLAHRKAIKGTDEKGAPTFGPGIFTTFVPDRIEYITKGTEKPEELAALVERGITPVKVVRDTDIPGLLEPAPQASAPKKGGK
jgi:hypothetical protein